jgi:hypothetical protein
MDENPFKCTLKIKKSIHKFSLVDKGGYMVQPTPAPPKFGTSAPEATCKVE